MGLSALYLDPGDAESQTFVIVHHHHPNNLHTPQVLHSMSDVHQIKIYLADEFDPIEHEAIPQITHLSAKFSEEKKYKLPKNKVWKLLLVENKIQSRFRKQNVCDENRVENPIKLSQFYSFHSGCLHKVNLPSLFSVWPEKSSQEKGSVQSFENS